MSVSTFLQVLALLSLFLHRALAQSGNICIDPPLLIIENEGPLRVTFARKQGTSGTITATYTILPLTATTADYSGSSTGTIIMTDGETTAFLDIPIINDEIMEPTEQFRFMLTGPDVGPDSNVLVNIQDDDVYSPWTEWVDGTCSTTCDPGVQTDTRDRTCVSPFATLCVQPLTDNRTIPCNLGDCTVITEWSQWANSTACSVTCGSGTVSQARNRTCSANCPANFMEMETRTVPCDENPCPVITEWSKWANSGACSVSCGSGAQTQVRNRTCSANCPGSFMGIETRTVRCYYGACASGHGIGWSQLYRLGRRTYHGTFGTHRSRYYGTFGTHRSRYYGTFGTHQSRYYGRFGTHGSRYYGRFGTRQTGWTRRRYGYYG